MKRSIVMMVMGLAFLMPFSAGAFSGNGCAGNCTDCHKLEKREAEEIIKKMSDKNLIPNGRVVDVKLAPSKGLWQIDLDVNGRQGPIYLDFSKKYIIGQLIALDDVAKMPPPPPTKVDFSKIPLKNALVLGPKNAAKKIVVITDPDCPFCRNLHAEIGKVLQARKDTAFYLILYPLPIHKDSYKKVQTLLCARSIKLVNEAFEGKPLPEPSCSNKPVEKNKELVQNLGFKSTPTLIRYDGEVLTGARPADQLSAWIDGK